MLILPAILVAATGSAALRSMPAAVPANSAMRRARLLPLLAGVACLLSACNTFEGAAVRTTAEIQDPVDLKYYPSDEPLKLGMEHFGRGNYGLSERYFRDAVEKTPRDVTAWVGLAASYDRLSRFDLADQSYAQAVRLSGETLQILNNEGYSFLLRGDLARARQKFTKAYQLDPTNAVVRNNMELLNSSRRFVQRESDQT
jgi:Flp pilus assembly protein TadD